MWGIMIFFTGGVKSVSQQNAGKGLVLPKRKQNDIDKLELWIVENEKSTFQY